MLGNTGSFKERVERSDPMVLASPARRQDAEHGVEYRRKWGLSLVQEHIRVALGIGVKVKEEGAAEIFGGGVFMRGAGGM